MKKLFFTLILLSILVFQAPVKSYEEQEMTFEEAFNEVNRTPMLVLVYADWADNYEACLYSFQDLKKEFGNYFNYVELDIASWSTKAFNRRFKIDQNLPYLIMFRDGGKISRYLNTQCVLDNSCVVQRIKSFIQ